MRSDWKGRRGRGTGEDAGKGQGRRDAQSSDGHGPEWKRASRGRRGVGTARGRAAGPGAGARMLGKQRAPREPRERGRQRQAGARGDGGGSAGTPRPGSSVRPSGAARAHDCAEPGGRAGAGPADRPYLGA